MTIFSFALISPSLCFVLPYFVVYWTTSHQAGYVSVTCTSECLLRISAQNGLSWLWIFMVFIGRPKYTPGHNLEKAKTNSFRILSNYLFPCRPTSRYISRDSSSSVNKAVLSHQHMLRVNTHIIVQNIQSLGISSRVKNCCSYDNGIWLYCCVWTIFWARPAKQAAGKQLLLDIRFLTSKSWTITLEELLQKVFYTRSVQIGYITRTPAEAGSNTSTVAMRFVGGDEKGTQCLRV
jgi:hypothetical protein